MQITNYEIKVKQFQQENDDLRRRIQDLADVNKKISEY